MHTFVKIESYCFQTVEWTAINSVVSCWFWRADVFLGPHRWAACLLECLHTALYPAAPTCPPAKVKTHMYSASAYLREKIHTHSLILTFVTKNFDSSRAFHENDHFFQFILSVWPKTLWAFLNPWRSPQEGNAICRGVPNKKEQLNPFTYRAFP